VVIPKPISGSDGKVSTLSSSCRDSSKLWSRFVEACDDDLRSLKYNNEGKSKWDK
jgi:hypothetical protein